MHLIRWHISPAFSDLRVYSISCDQFLISASERLRLIHFLLSVFGQCRNPAVVLYNLLVYSTCIVVWHAGKLCLDFSLHLPCRLKPHDLISLVSLFTQRQTRSTSNRQVWTVLTTSEMPWDTHWTFHSQTLSLLLGLHNVL